MEDDHTVIFLTGPINEFAADHLNSLQSKKKPGKYTFDFKGIDYVNSLGLRVWVNFFNSFQEGKVITFRNCTPDIIMQINMVASFSKGATIESFIGRFMCMECDSEKDYLFDGKKSREALLGECSTITCENCDVPMELETDEESFLEFKK